MPDKKEKSRQATVKPESPNNGGENNGNANENTDGELVFNTGMTGHNSTAPFALIPGFSQAQMFDLMIMIAVTMNIRFEQRFGNFDTNRQQNSPFPNTQDYQPHQEQQSLMPDQNLSHTTDSSHHTNPSQLRAEEVGYFDPEYQPEHGQQEPIINADKHVYYRDVYVFVDRPKDLATRYNIIHVIALYLRGSALMWYSMELTDLERTGLQFASRQSQQRQWQHGTAPQDPVPGRYTNGQRGAPQQQHTQPYKSNNRLPTRIFINDDKAHAYLTEITPDGYGIYGEEDELYQEYQQE
ncbi:hypothetical protein IMSHALPRED_000729 [Imshaugia aleurites]|uniref:Uncharacterized protein n=1 Tax=Imshaugia aleurites TaxID=172621 RepID=A0A8H3G843_9LECA|nr:hypothetical protein IMSHALPRED_000729 [Imshaugia aleurites]